LLWATNTLQSDKFERATRFLDPKSIPKGAITTKISSEFFIYKWEIETLVNELMTTRKTTRQKDGKTYYLNYDNFSVSLECAKWLRKLENIEYRIVKKSKDIFLEMGRLAARQFGWQRGVTNLPQFYRNAFIYGQGKCAAYFEDQHGISLNRFSEIGFMLYVSLTDGPFIVYDESWKAMGVSMEELDGTLSLLAAPYTIAQKRAISLRGKVIHTADKPSILRQTPCLRFGKLGERILAPLPDLIIERITSGIYYDVVSGDGGIRAEYGKRFEEYCFDLLGATLVDWDYETEFKYKVKSQDFLSPDIQCSQFGNIQVAIECKATRMSQQAMFGSNPIEDRGYEDLAKAVFQLWRFFSHCRRGLTDRPISQDVAGVVLTLDNWLIMSEPLRKSVFAKAVQMTHEKDEAITEEDRKNVVFVTISELENVLTVATAKSLTEALHKSTQDGFIGWRIDGLMQDMVKGTGQATRDYPFADSLGQLLPWWDEMGRRVGD
jgi:hypothetical protein